MASRSYGDASFPSKSTSIHLLPCIEEEYYRCSHCNHVTLKSSAKISGYDSEHSLRHVHCPSCGRTIAWPSRENELKDKALGIFLTVAGGAAAVLLYPFLNVYGLHWGFFVSLYGLLKILVI